MRTRLLLTMFFVLITVGALAGTRTKEEMKEAAMRVLVKNSAARGMTKSTSSSELKEYLTKEKLSILGNEELGFAIVTNDDRFDEVIGYSTTSYTDTVPCGYRWWLEGVELMMENEFYQPALARASKVSVNGSVAPLMKTEWGQDNPFNAQLKFRIGDNSDNSFQCLTGCVATAMAQVMKYHEYPEKSQGSIEYVVRNFMAKMSHTFGDTYDWKNMLDKYNYQIYGSLDAPAKAVSILMRDCGMAVEMNYGTDASGTQSSKIAPGLITYFSYDSEGTKLYKRSDYQKDTWMQMIYDELKAGRPIIYNGSDSSDPRIGHSFVLHGYDSTGKVYINWGAKGSYDGYFDIDMLNIDKNDYNANQDMVFVKPGSGLATTYTLSITSSGNGLVTYSGNTINNTTKSFTINEGTSATLTFTPNTGYRVKSVKVNNIDVTSSISNNKYTINNITQNTTVNVTFEAIPVNTYALSITSTGNGQVTYSSNTINNTTKSFTINEGTSATLTFTPNTGYQVKSVKVNNIDVTSSVSNNKYTINNITQNTTVNVTFEAIPVNTYALSITSTGNGQVTYSSNTINNTTKSFNINEGTSATLTFTPNTGYQVKSVKVNNVDVTSSVSNNKYTINNINQNTEVSVTFEAIPVTSYTLSISTTGNGQVTYLSNTINNTTKSFTVNEGTSATFTFTPNTGYRLKSVKVNNVDVTSSISNNKYAISSISQNTTINVVFESMSSSMYTITVNSHDDYGYTEINGVVIKNGSQEFTVSEGENFIVTAVPNEGYRVSQIRTKKEGYAASLFNYTDNSSKRKSEGLYNVKQNGTIDVYFEKIPAVKPQYTITVNSHDDYGYTEINGVVIRNGSQEFTVSEGENFIVTAVPNEGYRVSQIRTKKEGFAASLFNYTDDSSKKKSEGLYNIKQNGTIDVYFEKIPAVRPQYTITVNSHDEYGYTEINGVVVKNSSQEFTVSEGENFIVTAVPNEGYRVSQIRTKKEGFAASLFNYTDDSSKRKSEGLYNIKQNGTIDVYFEKIEGLPQSYSLTISSSGSGYVSYLENNISETTKSFTLDTNASATLTFIPNSGYQLKSVMVNNVDVTSNVSNNKYTIININKNTSVEVVFEAESNNALVDNYPVQSAQFDLINGKVVFVSNWSEFSYYALTQKLDNMTKEYFDANYEPDLLATNIGTTSDGYSIDQLKIFKSFTLKGDANASNDLGIAPYYSNWQGTTNHRFTWVLTADELERLTNNQSSPVQITRYVRYKEKSKISPRPKYPYIYIKMTVNLTRKASYTLSIQSTGNGSVSYDGTIIRDSKKTFNVVDGNSVTISLAPDNGYRIKSVEVNSLDVTSSISNNQYSINNISKNTSVNVAFEPDTNTNSVLSCSDLSCYTSSSPTLKVNLQNVDEVKLCQFDLRLPNGVKIAKKSNGKLNATLTARADGHSISSSQLTNGDYRFIISSMSNDSFTGNSGTLVEITLDVPATMASGEYTVKVMNVELSVPNGNDLRVVKPKDTDSKLTIVSYKPGDVNNDGSVSVTDVGCVINYILEQVPSTFIFGAADMNSDGEVSVTDVGIIINQILSGEASSRNYTSHALPLSGHMSLLPIADGYQLTLENMDAFIGLQFDMEGADLDDIQLIGGNDHLLAYRQLANGKYRVVCYSPTNNTFISKLSSCDIENPLLKFSSTDDVIISNICLTTSNFDELRPSALEGTMTGIATVEEGLQISVQSRTLHIISDRDVTIPVFTLGGNVYRTLDVHHGENNFDGLRAGVYMIENKKIILR